MMDRATPPVAGSGSAQRGGFLGAGERGMKKVFHVALREFLAIAATKGFIIAILLPPVLGAVMIVIFPRLLNEQAPRVVGEVAVLDPTGQVADSLRERLSPESLARRRQEIARQAKAETPEEVQKIAGPALSAEAMRQGIDRMLGEVPRLNVVALPPGSDLEREKQPLKGGKVEDGGRLALVVIQPDAVVRPEGKKTYGAYDIYVRSKLDDRVVDEIRDAARDAIISARARVQGLDRAAIEALVQVPKAHSRTVTAQGERGRTEIFYVFLPVAFMLLLMMSVMISGSTLMTMTVEEKSSRVAEVLLSAVSPMQLMAGKVLGGMGAGLLVMPLYGSLGVMALISFALLGLLDWMLIVYLMVFFLIAYFLFASIMAAIGSAVNEMREAQSLLTPVTLLIMVPYILWFPISRNPNSALSMTMSFLPPFNSFAMLLRITSTSPPPSWQIWLSVLIGAVSSVVALWAAGKIFRIGLLMYGKPPNLATLFRWIRMA